MDKINDSCAPEDPETFLCLAELFGLLVTHFRESEYSPEAPMVDLAIDLIAHFAPSSLTHSLRAIALVFLAGSPPPLVRAVLFRLQAAVRRREAKWREDSRRYMAQRQREVAREAAEEIERGRALEGYLRSREKQRLKHLAQKADSVSPGVLPAPVVVASPVLPEVVSERVFVANRAAQEMADFDRALGLAS